MSVQGITLAGVSLQTAPFVVSKFVHEGTAIDESKIKIPHRPGEKMVAFTPASKAITLEGYIYDTSVSALDGDVDTLMSLYGLQGVSLQYDYNGQTGTLGRVYTVNVLNITIPRDYYNLTAVPFTIKCEAINPPYQQSPIQLTSYVAAVVSGTYSTTTSGLVSNISSAILGTATPIPYINFTVNVPGSLSSLQFTNLTTNTGMIVQLPTVVSGSQIQIDTTNFQVNFNGAKITTYSGTFPLFQIGTNNYTVMGFGASPNFSYEVSINYTEFWL